MKDDLTLIAVVLDRSSSMASCRVDMEAGINSFIKEQAQQPGEAKLFFSQFSDQYEVIAPYIDIKSAPYFPLVPHGMTALHDAVGKTVTDVGVRLANTPEVERPSKVIVVIVTDGGENVSKSWTQSMVKEAVERQTAIYNWQFTYLGANQDSFLVGSSIGIPAAATMDYVASAAGIQNTYGSLSSNVSAVRSRAAAAVNYSSDDREKAKTN
jgi:uncharacterized protein YegL